MSIYFSTSTPKIDASRSTSEVQRNPNNSPSRVFSFFGKNEPPLKNLHDRNISHLIDNEIDIELINPTSPEEQEIEKLLSEFYESYYLSQWVDVQVGTKKSIYKNITATDKQVKDGVEYIESILPEELFIEYPLLEEKCTKFCESINLSNLYLKFIDSGLSFLALIYKRKLIYNASACLQKIKRNYENRRLPEYVKKWEKDIEKEKKNLRKEFTNFALKTTKRVASSLKQIAKLISLKKTIPLAERYILLFSSSVKAYFNYQDFKKGRENAKAVDNWKIKIENWKNRNHHIVNNPQTNPLIPIPRISLINSPNHIVSKREQIFNKKLTDLMPQFDSLSKEIENAIKPSFIKKLNDLINAFLEKKMSYEQVIASLNEMGINTTIIANADDLSGFLKDLKSNPNKINPIFNQWYLSRNRVDLLKAYIHHQETIEYTLRPALQKMVSQKQELEAKFIHFEVISSGSRLCSHLITFFLSLVGSINPAFYLALTIAPIFSSWASRFNFVLMLKQNYMLNRYKNEESGFSSYFDNAQLLVNKFNATKIKYQLKVKQREFNEISNNLRTINKKSDEYKKVLEILGDTRIIKDSLDKQLNRWNKRIAVLEERIMSKTWLDFTKFADLTIGHQSSDFDTLQALSFGFKNCNFDLLDEETKELLETQLDFDLKTLQKEIIANPPIITYYLKKLFTLNESKYVSFITKQMT